MQTVLRLKGISIEPLRENTRVVIFCLWCNRFVCSGTVYTPNKNSRKHVSMDAQKFRRCKGYTHRCAYQQIRSKDDFGDFYFELLLK